MTFNSEQHPRGHASNAGSFSDKTQGAPEINLTNDIKLNHGGVDITVSKTDDYVYRVSGGGFEQDFFVTSGASEADIRRDALRVFDVTVLGAFEARVGNPDFPDPAVEIARLTDRLAGRTAWDDGCGRFNRVGFGRHRRRRDRPDRGLPHERGNG